MVRIKTTECALKDIQPGELFSMFPSRMMEAADSVGVACYIRTEKRSANGSEGIVHRVEVEKEGPKVQTLGDLWRLLPAMGYSADGDDWMLKRVDTMDVSAAKPGAGGTGAVIMVSGATLYEGLDYQRMFDILQRLEGLLV